MPPVRGRRRATLGVTTLAVAMPTVGTPAARMTLRTPLRLARSERTGLVSMTCTAMYGSGSRIVGTAATQVRRLEAKLGRRVGTAASASCAAARGTSIQKTFALRVASGLRPMSGTSSTGSALPERFKFLLPYLFTSYLGGPGGPPPGRGSVPIGPKFGRLLGCVPLHS